MCGIFLGTRAAHQRCPTFGFINRKITVSSGEIQFFLDFKFQKCKINLQWLNYCKSKTNVVTQVDTPIICEPPTQTDLLTVSL